MATYNKFNSFVEQLASGSHNFPSHSIAVYLSNDPPTASSDTVKTDVTEITVQNGYPGPIDVTGSMSRSGGTVTYAAGADKTVTATGTVGPFRYVVAYDKTSPTGLLVSWWDYGSEVTLANGESFTMDFNPNIWTLA